MRNLLDAMLTGTLDVSALTNKAAVRTALEITESGDGPWISEQPALGGSLSVAEGIAFHAINSTLAAVGAQQVSPAVLWTGAGWKTVATAASQAVTFRAYISPNQGTSNPSGNWTLQSSINGGAFANSLVFSSAGQLDVPGGLNVAGLTALDGPVTAETPGATITLSPEDAAVILAPPGTGTVTINPGTTGSINNMAAALTTLSLTGALTLPDNVRQTFNPGATVAGLNVGSQAGDPSTPINGDVWYDSIANTLDARINGATVILGTGDPPPPPFDPASPGPIGGTTPGTGAFTALSASGALDFSGAPSADFPLGLILKYPDGAPAIDVSTQGVVKFDGGNFQFDSGGVDFISFAVAAEAFNGTTFNGKTIPVGAGTLVSATTLSNSTLPGAFTTLSASGLISTTSNIRIGTSLALYWDASTVLNAPANGSLRIGNFAATSNVTLVAEANDTLQMGVDAGTPVNQTFKAHDWTSGGTGIGAALTVKGGDGTAATKAGAIIFNGGTATAGGSLVFQTAATGTLTDRMTIDKDGVIVVPNSINIGNSGGAGAGVIINGGGTLGAIAAAAGGSLYISSGDTSHSIFFRNGSTDRWSLNSSGHFFATTHNTYDIGASAATSPRSIYFGTSLFQGSTKLLGAQGAAVADATDNPSAITQLNALLARLRAHGLIAT